MKKIRPDPLPPRATPRAPGAKSHRAAAGSKTAGRRAQPPGGAVTARDWRRLERAARAAAARAYAPYSHFRVGAAVLADTGRIAAGCNVENASYGLTCCAERNAVGAAVAAGAASIRAVVIYTPTPQPTPPCGACRQVLAELGPATQVVAVCDGTERIDASITKLLPGPFGGANLGRP